MSKQQRRSAGFTLVELLVVILIIGILIAILIPAVQYVVRKARLTAVAYELSQLEQAVQNYKTKYADFPTDFADVWANTPQNWPQTVTYRHIRKAFPRITAAELTIVGTFIKGYRLTPAESLVFWLGGISSNPAQPFTGTGGPLVNLGTQATPIWGLRIQERNAPIFVFEEDRLITRTDPVNGQVIAASYASKFTTTPYVYFDSRTYHFVYDDGNGNILPGYAANTALAPGDPASSTVALPYKSDIANTNFPSSQNDSILLDNAVYFANRDTFQIVSPGLDGLYGPLVNAGSPALIYDDNNNNPVPLFTRFPSGKGFHPSVWVTQPQNANPPYDYYFEGQEDNLTSFSEGKTLEDAQQQ